MNKFPSIESLRHVIHDVNTHCEYAQLTVKPVVKFRGTVKLHGTNGGLCVTPEGTVAQSRNNELSIGNDNAGFAQWSAGREADNATRVVAGLAFPDSLKVMVFGEWCGGSIMKGTAINQLSKHFVVFAIQNIEYGEENAEWADMFALETDAETLKYLNDRDIFLVTQAETFEVVIDFNDPQAAADIITELTLKVEDQCPYGTLHGVTGIGEGIVWNSYDYPINLKFKSKGLKHKKAGKRESVGIAPETVEAISDLVDEILPVWRLEQGLSDSGCELTAKGTGQYIKWIAQDILKEEEDTIAANAFTWKELQGVVTNRAREYFFNHLDQLAGVTAADGVV